MHWCWLHSLGHESQGIPLMSFFFKGRSVTSSQPSWNHTLAIRWTATTEIVSNKKPSSVLCQQPMWDQILFGISSIWAPLEHYFKMCFYFKDTMNRNFLMKKKRRKTLKPKNQYICFMHHFTVCFDMSDNMQLDSTWRTYFLSSATVVPCDPTCVASKL